MTSSNCQTVADCEKAFSSDCDEELRMVNAHQRYVMCVVIIYLRVVFGVSTVSVARNEVAHKPHPLQYQWREMVMRVDRQLS